MVISLPPSLPLVTFNCLYLQHISKRSWQIFCQNCSIVLRRLKVSRSRRSYLHIPRWNCVSGLPESCCPSAELLPMEDEQHTLALYTLYKLVLVLNPCLPVTGFACAAIVFNFFYFNNCRRQNTYTDFSRTANNKAENRMALRLYFIQNSCLITNLIDFIMAKSCFRHLSVTVLLCFYLYL